MREAGKLSFFSIFFLENIYEARQQHSFELGFSEVEKMNYSEMVVIKLHKLLFLHLFIAFVKNEVGQFDFFLLPKGSRFMVKVVKYM